MNRMVVIILFLLASSTVIAQDKIFMKKGEVIKAKITEIGVAEIKYKLFDEPDGPVYVIEKDRLLKIEFENGRKASYKTSLKDPELYDDQSKHAVKFNFLSPLFGHTWLAYEKSLKPGRSLELSLSIIGLGKDISTEDYYYDPNTNTSHDYKRGSAGAAVGFGYKFIKTPDFINNGSVRFAHLLQGSYLKPIVYTGFYQENAIVNKANMVTKEKKSIVYGTMMLELGKQWVIDNKVILDMFLGFGYSLDNIRDHQYWQTYSDEYSAFHYTHGKIGRTPGLAVNTGFKIGLLLGQEKSSPSKSSSR